MPDAAAPEIQFKATETLHYGGETTIGTLSPDMQRAKDRGAQLRKEKASSANAKSFLESYKNKSSEKNLTRQNKEDLDLRFGAGETKRNATGAIEVPTTPDAKALFDEAQAELKNINNYIQYSEITAEAKKPGKSVATVISERVTKGIEGPRSQAEFDAQKEKVLDYIINTEVIQKGLPEVAAIASVAERRKLIEETLAADPALKAKILEKMIGIADRAKALPEPPVSKEVKEAEDSKKESGVKITENLDLIRDRLKDLGFDDVRVDELRKDVEKYIKDGKSIDQVLGYLRSESINQLNKAIPTLEESLRKYSNASGQVEVLGKKLDQFILAKVAPEQIEILQVELNSQQGIIDDFEKDDALVVGGKRYEEILRTFSNQKDSSSSAIEGGILVSPVANSIDQIIKAQKAIVNAEKVIKEKGDQSRKDQDAWRSDRLVQESNLISEMKNVLPSSIAEVLSDRYDEMVGLERQRMEKVAKDQEEKGEKAVADGIRKVEQAKEKKWIEYDPISRDKKIHTNTLASDMKYAAYGGEEAIKRLILRDSGLSFGLGPGTVGDWQTVDLSRLSEDTQKTLEGIYEQQKDSYKQKLFGDFFLGKSFVNRRMFGIQLGELALKKHEYELLETKFATSFEQSVNSRETAKATMEKLKASGVKPSGGLLFLLAMLFGGAFVGAKKLVGAE